VAKLAVLGNDLPLSGFIFAVVAAETARRVKMTDVFGIGVPGDLHGGKKFLP
jgi:hypothetical protein